MTPLDLVLPVLVRWAGLVALAAVLGGLVVELLVLPRGTAELAAAHRRLRWWNRTARLDLHTARHQPLKRMLLILPNRVEYSPRSRR